MPNKPFHIIWAIVFVLLTVATAGTVPTGVTAFFMGAAISPGISLILQWAASDPSKSESDK